MKKIISILLTAAMVIAIMPVAEVATSAEGGTLSTGLTWDLTDGTLTISGNGAMPNFGYSDVPWDSDRDSIQTVVIESGVTSIGDEAFNGCYSLTEITIPDSVTSIGEYAFDCCVDLTEIIIPNSVTSIGYYAFRYCVNLIEITIPAGVTGIGYGAFWGCFDLESITIESDNMVYSSLDGVLFNKEKTNIICYPSGKPDDSYTIPDSVTQIKYSAFNDSHNLTEINASPDNTEFCSIDGVLLNKQQTTIILCPKGRIYDDYIIPDSVTLIGDYAFGDCFYLNEITIPDSVTRIGSNAFEDCANLSEITIGNGVTSIGNNAFHYTEWLNNQPDGMVYVGGFAYTYNGEMPKNTSVTLKADTKGMTDYMFYFCFNLKSIIIPDSVTRISNGAFAECSNLTSVKIGNGVRSIGREAFSGCSRLTSITIPNSVTSIDAAFTGCTNLTSVTIPESVKCLSIVAFSLSGINQITFKSTTPPNITYECECYADDFECYYYDDFYTHGFFMSKIKNIYVPKGAKKAYSGGGWSKYDIKEIDIPCDDCGKYPCRCERYTYDVNQDGNTITITGYRGNGVNIIIPSVLDGKAVTGIGEMAFTFNAITSITIPAGVTSVGIGAFLGCVNLKSVTFRSETPPILGDNVFINAPISTIYVPIGSEAAYKAVEGLKEYNIVETVAFTLGRVLDNPTVGVADAVHIFMYLAKMKSSIINTDTTGRAYKAACITGDKPSVADAVQIFMFLAKMPSSKVPR